MLVAAHGCHGGDGTFRWGVAGQGLCCPVAYVSPWVRTPRERSLRDPPPTGRPARAIPQVGARHPHRFGMRSTRMSPEASPSRRHRVADLSLIDEIAKLW